MNTHYKQSAIRLNLTHQNVKMEDCQDNLISEIAVALVYNGISHTVMMCTPTDLEDFAIGFSLSEKIIEDKSEIYGIDVVEQCNGIEVHLEISSRRFMQLKEKRRSMAGRTGCGICGVEQLEQVKQTFCKISAKNDRLHSVNPLIFEDCLNQLEQTQRLNQETGASHAAAFFSPEGKVLAVREDVGRHVALDKLIGWYAKEGSPLGFVMITSRASFEIVQKCLAVDIEMLCAISAVTEMAAKMASENQFTLLGFTRKGKGTVYSGISRLQLPNRG